MALLLMCVRALLLAPSVVGGDRPQYDTRSSITYENGQTKHYGSSGAEVFTNGYDYGTGHFYMTADSSAGTASAAIRVDVNNQVSLKGPVRIGNNVYDVHTSKATTGGGTTDKWHFKTNVPCGVAGAGPLWHLEFKGYRNHKGPFSCTSYVYVETTGSIWASSQSACQQVGANSVDVPSLHHYCDAEDGKVAYYLLDASCTPHCWAHADLVVNLIGGDYFQSLNSASTFQITHEVFDSATDATW